MNEKILKAIGKSDVNLSIISIIVVSKRIGNKEMQFLCSQKLSHVTRLYLRKTIDIKLTTK
jgi:hypothetical protein